MQLSDFDYYLPEELIAQKPLENRDASRLLVLDPETGKTEHRHFYDICDYLLPGDLLVFNDTKVSSYRLFGRKSTGGRVECLLTRKLETNLYKAVVSPGRRLPENTVFRLDCGLDVKILRRYETGERLIRFLSEGDADPVIKKHGLVPLPPYIHEKLEDYGRYQTVYADPEGSAAAPTAGLHFTKELLAKIKDMGVESAFVTLHVGIGTFRPIRCDNIDEHIMHSERYIIPGATVEKVKNAKGRIIAVGTTSVRALESAAEGRRLLREEEADSRLFIRPPYDFKIADGLITNFHIPKSTLLLLVSALAGRENILSAYKEAVELRYRFFSFGDAMFIKPKRGAFSGENRA